MKLFIAGLPNDFDDTDLREMFELYGDVASAKVATDRETQKSKGFGFLDMPNDTEAKDAIQTLNGAKLKGGKQLVVKLSEEQPPRSNTGFAPRRNNFGNSNNNTSNRRY